MYGELCPKESTSLRNFPYYDYDGMNGIRIGKQKANIEIFPREIHIQNGLIVFCIL